MKRFSGIEDGIIVAYVKANPLNLQQAFDHASADLPRRSRNSIVHRWYRNLRNDAEVLFCLGGVNNIKNKIRK